MWASSHPALYSASLFIRTFRAAEWKPGTQHQNSSQTPKKRDVSGEPGPVCSLRSPWETPAGSGSAGASTDVRGRPHSLTFSPGESQNDQRLVVGWKGQRVPTEACLSLLHPGINTHVVRMKNVTGMTFTHHRSKPPGLPTLKNHLNYDKNSKSDVKGGFPPGDIKESEHPLLGPRHR